MVRKGDEVFVLKQSEFGDERTLHRAFKENPGLFPHEDFGLRPFVIVGREVAFKSGYADHIAVDADGNIILIEFKRRENQTHRELLAQVLDYASDLWSYTYDDFERTVVLKYFRGKYYPKGYPQFDSLVSAVEDSVEVNEPEGNFDEETFRGNIENRLKNGSFTLILACTEVSDVMRRVMEYVNFAFSMRVFGLEIDIYRDEEREILVPRAIAPRPPSKATKKTDIPTFISSCSPEDREKFGQLIAKAQALEVGDITLGEVGFSYRIRFENGTASAFGAYPTKSSSPGIDVIFSRLQRQGVPQDVIEGYRSRLQKVRPFRLSESKSSGRLKMEEVSDKDIENLIESVKWLSKELEEISPS